MNFRKEYILENDKVQLRPLQSSDYGALLIFSETEPDLWRFNAPGAQGAANLKKYIDTALNSRDCQSEYPFVVFDKQQQRIIGSTRFYQVNPVNKTLEIGYTWYGKAFQGTYVNKNCKYLLLACAFEQLGMERVGFRANSLNQRSIAAMKSIGCKEEGVLRSYSTDVLGQRIDATVLSILKAEWYAAVGPALKVKIDAKE